ncbi:MAG: hypothetical protein IIC91_09695 [Chloroflexi bacterium]|nr:hypothetical protein [Chloroflexota bacterium]
MTSRSNTVILQSERGWQGVGGRFDFEASDINPIEIPPAALLEFVSTH